METVLTVSPKAHRVGANFWPPMYAIVVGPCETNGDRKGTFEGNIRAEPLLVRETAAGSRCQAHESQRHGKERHATPHNPPGPHRARPSEGCACVGKRGAERSMAYRGDADSNLRPLQDR